MSSSVKWFGAVLLTGVALVSGCGTGSSPVTPTIVWATPEQIMVGTALSSTQLDAAAVVPGTSTPVAGTYVYTAPFGTVENTAGTVTLSVAFTPANTSAHNSATASVFLVVAVPTKTTPTIAWATPAAVTVGTALSATLLDATASAGVSPLPGTFVYAPTLGTVESAAGSQTLSATFTPTDTTDYNSATATVAITVNAGAPAISWPAPAAVSIDTFLSATQLGATVLAPGGSSLPGTFTYSPAAGSEMTTAGSQTLSVTFTPTDATDYTAATGTVTLDVEAPSYTFTPVRIIGGGYTPGIVMHPAQNGLMYSRTDVGGAYRWDNTNSIWVPLTDFVTSANRYSIGIESIGIDPSDVQRLYLAAGELTESNGTQCMFYASDNQGNAFTTLPMPFKCGSNDSGRGAGERLAVDPNLGGNILWGTRQNGLWQSANYGATWTELTNFPVTGATSGGGIVFEDYIKSSASTGNATQTIYVGVSATGTGTDPASLYVTTNGGTTWSAVPGAPTGFYVSHGVQGPDGNLYFSFGDQIGPDGVLNGRIWQYVVPNTTNPNGVWNNITPPRPSGTQGGYGAVALDPEKPGVIMVSTLNYPIVDDLWRSNDYGKTWSSLDTVGLSLDDSLSPFLLFGASSTAGFGTGHWVTALAIDPFNSDHLVYGTSSTIEQSTNLTVNDTGGTVNVTVGALGVEETVASGLISPPEGPANLLSVMYDLDGFEHTDLTVSPANGTFQNPGLSTGTSIDFAQSVPTNIARVGNYNGNTPASAQLGGYSTDSGADWVPFGSSPSGTVTGGGSIAVSADATTLVWSPNDLGSNTSYSTDNGTTWTVSTGALSASNVYSDRLNAKKFYMYNPSASEILMSTDGGQTFSVAMNNVPSDGTLYVGFDAEGSLYITNGGGLYHAALNATSFTQISAVQSGWAITQGAASSGSTTPTLFLGGTIGGNAGLYRSTDGGGNWIRFDGPENQYGYINAMTGDPRVFGRLYLGTAGRGILHADSPY